jgi:hypothetical protein
MILAVTTWAYAVFIVMYIDGHRVERVEPKANVYECQLHAAIQDDNFRRDPSKKDWSAVCKKRAIEWGPA